MIEDESYFTFTKRAIFCLISNSYDLYGEALVTCCVRAYREHFAVLVIKKRTSLRSYQNRLNTDFLGSGFLERNKHNGMLLVGGGVSLRSYQM